MLLHPQEGQLKQCAIAGWRQISSRAADLNVPSEGVQTVLFQLCRMLHTHTLACQLMNLFAERPQTYKAAPSGGSAWGKPSLHLQVGLLACL